MSVGGTRDSNDAQLGTSPAGLGSWRSAPAGRDRRWFGSLETRSCRRPRPRDIQAGRPRARAPRSARVPSEVWLCGATVARETSLLTRRKSHVGEVSSAPRRRVRRRATRARGMALDDASMSREAAERLALELDAALAADPLVDELAFLPSASPADVFGPNEATHPPGLVTSAASPGAFTLVEHKLALSARALVPLHAFASAAFRRARDAEGTREDALVGVDPVTGADAIRLLLVVNGDHATAWNARKRRALASLASIRRDDDAARRAVADAELRFAEMVLSKFPKAQSCWAHSRWVLVRVSRVASSASDGNPTDDRPDARAAIFAEESRVAELAATRKRLNYAAWAHRRWCARGHRGWGEPEGDVAPFEVSSIEPALKPSSNAPPTARDETSPITAAFTTARRSCATTRTRRTRRPASRRVEYLDRVWDWASESAFVGELIERFPGREALWAHRRFVFHGWCEAASREGASVAAPSVDDERRARLYARRSAVARGRDAAADVGGVSRRGTGAVRRRARRVDARGGATVRTRNVTNGDGRRAERRVGRVGAAVAVGARGDGGYAADGDRRRRARREGRRATMSGGMSLLDIIMGTSSLALLS